MLYNDYAKLLQDRFSAELTSIQSDYNFDLGDEFEIVICKILRSFLPNKYGVCRGSAVSANGEKAGDDIIIYDQELFPTLWLRDANDFSRKENIPREAVYAYIEAKHGYTEAALQKAIEQVRIFKALCSTRERRGQYQFDPYVDDHRSVSVRGLPSFRNPVLGMILVNKAKRDTEETKNNIQKALNTFSADINYPDVIIVGKSNGAFVGYEEQGKSVPTIFALPSTSERHFGYQNMIKEDLMFGVFMTHLMAALDYIRLGKMPWVEILNDAKQL